jgi:cytochrome c-type biogenesis protein CcmH
VEPRRDGARSPTLHAPACWGLKLAAALSLALALGLLITSPRPVAAQAAPPIPRETQEIARTLKCPVCESQSVADSPSQLSQEMRGYIERRLEAGESRDAIVQDLTDRYGEGILLEPPRRGFTLIIWWLPILSLGIGALVVGLTLRRVTSRSRPVPLVASAVPEPGAPAAVGAASPAADHLPGLAPDEEAHYRARLAAELARRDRGPA